MKAPKIEEMKESLTDKFYQPAFNSKISQKGLLKSQFFPN
jgi:hypothetical protein